MIKTNIEFLRDPFTIERDGTYYVYGTGVDNDDWDNTVWTCYKNTSGRLDGEWVKVGAVAEMPEWATKNRWAPEVHLYNGEYYLFGSYYSEKAVLSSSQLLPKAPSQKYQTDTLIPPIWSASTAPFT